MSSYTIHLIKEGLHGLRAIDVLRPIDPNAEYVYPFRITRDEREGRENFLQISDSNTEFFEDEGELIIEAHLDVDDPEADRAAAEQFLLDLAYATFKGKEK